MINRYIRTLAVVVMMVAALMAGCAKQEKQARQTIGISQYMEHPLLEETRKGLMAELQKEGLTEAAGYPVTYRNAGGDQPTALQINQQFVDQRVAVIVALGTPSAQSACRLTKTIPVVFGAITDPVAAGLADSETVPGGNKTGTSDRWPYEKQMALIRQIVPSAKTIGIVLNPGEANTEASMKYIRPLLENSGLKAIEVPVANSSEVMGAAKSLVGRCDAMLVPGDNTVIAAISSIVRVANENHIPLFAGDADSVEKGALATYGNNYYEIGVETGRIVAKILKQKASPGTLPVTVATDADLIVNLKAAEEQGVRIPPELIQKAKKVIR